jgi:hypothetical protein
VNAANAAFLRQTGKHDGKWFFKDMGLLSPQNIEGHDVSPTTVDFNGDGIPDFLGGAEDGHFFTSKIPAPKNNLLGGVQKDCGLAILQARTACLPSATPD